MKERQLLRDMFEAAIAAASPDKAVPANLPPPPAGRTVVVGAGKAAASMARAVEAHWPADKPLAGLVVTRYGHGVGPLKRIEVVEAAHPIPDAAGQKAARRILDLVKGLGPDDLALCLISGGGSALLSLPAPGITLDDKQALNKALLRSGANINEINCVRKHLSAIKGGRLAVAAAPARIVSLIISDVPGDDPSVIASGPTTPDATTLADAKAVLRRYGIVAVLRRCRRFSTTPQVRDAQAGRPGLRAQRNAHHRRSASFARGRGAGCEPGRLSPAHPRRRARGRGERGRQSDGRNRAPGRRPRPAGARSLRPHLGRRNDGDGQGRGPGREERRVPAVAGGRTRRPASDLRHRRRHRWRGRGRGGRGRDRHPRQPRAREAPRPQRASVARRQRRAHGSSGRSAIRSSPGRR